MTQTPYKFSITSGMDGYMPNYQSGPYCATTRAELADILRAELEMLNYPVNRFADFNVRRLWRFVQFARSGSSCHSHCDEHNAERMSIYGLTDAEYDDANDLDA